MIKKIGGWGNFCILCLLISFLIYGYFRKQSRASNALYVVGISKGIKKEVRGSAYLRYSFTVRNEQFEGEVPEDFCKQCPLCCEVGDTVIVRYQSGNPQNNDLIVKLPEGASLQDNR